MNQKNKSRLKKSKGNNRRAPSDDIFISGPVHYEPPPTAQTTSSFININSPNQTISRSRGGANNNVWSNRSNALSQTQSQSQSQSQSTSISPQQRNDTVNSNSNANNVNSNPAKQNLNDMNNHLRSNTQHSAAAPVPARMDNSDYPTLSEPTDNDNDNATANNNNGSKVAAASNSSHSLKSNKSNHGNDNNNNNNNKTNNTNSSSSSSTSIMQQHSTWLDYDEETAMDDFDPTFNINNGSRPQSSHNSTPHHNKSAHSLHADESSQTENNSRFPMATKSQHSSQHSTPRHQQTSRQFQPRRPQPNQNAALIIDPGSFKRHNTGAAGGAGNGYYDHKQAAVLESFNHNKPRADKRRRSNKYTVKIRGGGKGRDSEHEIHWSSKKRFIPNGPIPNFTPEFKPHRRPSYRAYLQEIKDREKRDDEQLEQFHKDRQHFNKKHAAEWMENLEEKQNKKLAEQQLQQQQQLDASMQASFAGAQSQRGPNMSRSSFLFGRPMGVSNISTGSIPGLGNVHNQPSPPGIAPLVNMPNMDMSNVSNFLRGIAHTPSSTNTPPFTGLPHIPTSLPLPTQQLLQRQTEEMLKKTTLNTDTTPQLGAATGLSATTPFHAGLRSAEAQKPTQSQDINTNSRGPSPFGNSNNHQHHPHIPNSGTNASPFIATGTNTQPATKSSTVTPQTNPSLTTALPPSISLETGGAFGQNATSQFGKINFLPPFQPTPPHPGTIQFSQQLYQQNQQRLLQQHHQQQQQQQTLSLWGKHQQQQQQQQPQTYGNVQNQQHQWNQAQPGQAQSSHIAYAQDFHGSQPQHSYPVQQPQQTHHTQW
eukprot:CAMPEP_0197041810 /NCGR_PEP_ID=MMETSP1384-20130603/18293_1 /TAXON_ID=29189 /ORGANISM="Ammonia sp." /LENGTH=817 /DNA_ID=CAMNT_0042472795 /DNA_START=75 /DNA_END=2525 /DNA_ORIENTATION=+